MADPNRRRKGGYILLGVMILVVIVALVVAIFGIGAPDQPEVFDDDNAIDAREDVDAVILPDGELVEP